MNLYDFQPVIYWLFRVGFKSQLVFRIDFNPVTVKKSAGKRTMVQTGFQQFLYNADRFAEVVQILAKHGLSDWLSSLSIGWLEKYLKGARTADSSSSLTTEKRIRLAITELGTTFIKFGQVLSTRPDLVGQELADELANLRSNTPADDSDTVLAIVESELNGSVDELFAKFDSTAMASASIGQVHRAQTHDGEDVVVKVQHAGIEKEFVNDLDILIRLAELAESHSSTLRHYRPVKTAKEFRGSLLKELDFNREMQNMLRFREDFANDKAVRFPKPYPKLSSRRVLTMERFEGVSVSDTEPLHESGFDLEDLAKRGANLFVEMIFSNGFYHADPHPGNLMVLSQPLVNHNASSASSQKKIGIIGVLDCGMVGRINEPLREDLERALMAVANKDAEQITEIIITLGEVPAGFDEPALLDSVYDFLEDYTTQSLDRFDLSGALGKIIDIVHQHKIHLPAKIAMLLKVLIMLEGTSKQLSPTFSLAEMIKPYCLQAAKKRFSPRRLFGKLQDRYRDWDRLMEIFPRDASEILRNFKRGAFDIHLEHRKLEVIVNRLVKGILTAALFVGSASLWSYKVPPTIYESSVPGMLGSVMALLLGFSILRDISVSDRINMR